MCFATPVSRPVRRSHLAVRMLAVTAMAAEGCSGDAPRRDTAVPPVPAVARAVGPAGGTVALADGPSLVIPDTALATTVTITITQRDAPAPAGALGPLFEFGPGGTTFATSVAVSFPAPRGGADGVVYWTKPGSASVYDVLPTAISTTATAQVRHFSAGFLGPPCAAGVACSGGIGACASGAIACSSGAPACMHAAVASDGASCGSGSGGTCRAGQCVPACGAGGWCWEHPIAGGRGALRAVWAGGAGDLWAVGDHGTILRSDGERWFAISDAGRDLYGVWGSAAHDVWMVGAAGTVLHWDGSTLTSVALGMPASLRAVWGSSHRDVWAVGDAGVAFRWDGRAWTRVPFPASTALRGVWGASASDVWAVGWGGAIFRWDGRSWRPAESGTTADLAAIWGRSANDVWAIGRDLVLHWDGASWSVAPFSAGGRTVLPFAELQGVWGSASDDVWAVGRGGVRETIYSGHSGYGTMIAHWDGTAWSPVHTRTADPLFAIAGVAWDRAWAVGAGGSVARWRGAGWELPPTLSGLTDVWGASSTDAWAVGDRGTILRRTAAGWSVFPSGTERSLRALWGSATDDVWAAGGAVLHWDGDAWTTVLDAGSEFEAIWGSSSTDVWAVGDDAWHWNGLAWTRVIALDAYYRFNSAWGSAASDLWLVGGYGARLRWDGTAWAGDPPGSSASTPWWKSVWGSAPDDVWVAGFSDIGGTAARVIRWDGTTWSDMPLPAEVRDVWRIWGRARDEVYLIAGVRDAGEGRYVANVLRWDGAEWSIVDLGSVASIWGLRGAPDGAIWAVGPWATVLRGP